MAIKVFISKDKKQFKANLHCHSTISDGRLTPEELKEKQEHLKNTLPSKKINVSFHHIPTSFLEGVFARGDRRLSAVIEKAWEKGCKFDGWSEKFLFDTWMESFKELGISPEFYANRRRDYEEVLPWDHLDFGVSKAFLMKESRKANEAETTPHCRIKCAGCSANKLNGGKCDV